MAMIPWDSILKFLFTITLMIIERVKEREELKREFLLFVSKFQEVRGSSVRLKKEYEDLMNEFKKDIKQ